MRNRTRTFAVIAAGGLLGVLALPGQAQTGINPLELIGDGPKPFVEPESFYRVVLPPGFNCKAQKRHVTCTGRRGQNALLQIDVLDVPKSATAKLHYLNQMERFQKKLHFQEISKEDIRLHGLEGVKVAFRYDYMGNVQFKVGVLAAYLKQENKIYSVHFESKLTAFQEYEKDLEVFFETFKPTPLDPGGNPILDELKVRSERNKAGVPNHLQDSTPVGW